MMRAIRAAAALGAVLLIAGCAATGGGGETGVRYKKPDTYNLRFIGFDTEIDDPVNDRRAYYKIFIDKAEEGRTTTGLESQEKTCETMLQPNRHLITVEKWVLDQKSGRYIKLNNIEQPRPNYVYFELPGDRIVVIEMRSRKDGTADFTVDFERR
jgi:hypothetical protein